MKELTISDIEKVNGGIWGFTIGYIAGKAIDSYVDWVRNGAGGWKEDYNGYGYDDPLL